MLLNKHLITEEIKSYLEKKWQWKQDNPKSMGCSKSSCKMEVYSNMILPQDTGKNIK